MSEGRDAVQNLQQVGRAELGRSTCGGHLLGQPDRLQRRTARARFHIVSSA
jgi:hypothetical protein